MPRDVGLYVLGEPPQVREPVAFQLAALKEATCGQRCSDQNVVGLREPESTSPGEEAGLIGMRHRCPQQRKRYTHHGAADMSGGILHLGFSPCERCRHSADMERFISGTDRRALAV